MVFATGLWRMGSRRACGAGATGKACGALVILSNSPPNCSAFPRRLRVDPPSGATDVSLCCVRASVAPSRCACPASSCAEPAETADQVMWSFIPKKRLRDSTCHPLGSRMRCCTVRARSDVRRRHTRAGSGRKNGVELPGALCGPMGTPCDKQAPRSSTASAASWTVRRDQAV